MTARDRKTADIDDAEAREISDAFEARKAREGPGSDVEEGSSGDARKKLEVGGAVPELARRIVAAGLQSFFVTEEVVRKAVGDSLPQDWIDFASDQSTRTQAEFMDRLVKEIGRVLEQTELADLLAKLLEDREVEVQATFRLLPAKEGEAPRVALAAKPPRSDRGE